jgi:prepilin-type N-terminal cleavage/methylation domain-containing protein
MKAIRRQRGFSLVEIIMVVAILALVMAAIFSLLLTASKNYQRGMALQDMLVLNDRVMTKMKRELISAQVSDTGFSGIGGQTGTNSYIEFQIPVDLDDGSGNMLPVTINGPTVTVNWGAPTRQGNLLDHWIRYQFVTIETVSEAAHRIDYNADQDMTDNFLRGRIVRQVYDDEIANPRTLVEEKVISGDYVFVRDPADVPDGADAGNDGRMSRLDGRDTDTHDDPLFRVVDSAGEPNASGDRIRIALFMAKRVNGRVELIARHKIITPVSVSIDD